VGIQSALRSSADVRTIPHRARIKGAVMPVGVRLCALNTTQSLCRPA